MIIPKTAVLSETANSAKIMNYIRQNSSKAYKQAVPAAKETAESVRAVGSIILGDEDLYNSFTPALINRIGRVVVQSKLYRNMFESFKLGYMELGDVVEEIFVNLISPNPFDPEKAEHKWMARELPDVLSAFHRINFKAFYKITISYEELRAAFLTWSGLHDLVGRIIEQAYTSANWDEFIMFKYILAKAAIQKQMYPVEVPDPDATNAKAVTTAMVAASNALLFMDSSYNAMGVTTYTDKDSQIMIINTKFAAIQDVEVLAQAFNMDKAMLQGRVVMINGFNMTAGEMKRLKLLEKVIGTTFPQFSTAELAILETIPAMLVDEKFFIVLDQLFDLKNAENGEGLYWNYWLHTWKLFSWSPFANAVLFTTTKSAVTTVTVTPATATVGKGVTKQFESKVVSTGLATEGGIWSVTPGGNGQTPLSAGTTIDKTGLLTVGIDEENTTISVVFTSNYDNTKSAAATVTVSA